MNVKGRFLREQQGSSDESDGKTNSHGHCKVCKAKSGNSKCKRRNEKISDGTFRFEAIDFLRKL